MFSLIRFRDNTYSVIKSKNVQWNGGKTCTVKWNGGKYTAFLLSINDNKRKLERLSKSHQRDATLSEINSDKIKLINVKENNRHSESPEFNSQNKFKQEVCTKTEITNTKLNNDLEEIHYRHSNDVLVEIRDCKASIKPVCKNQLTIPTISLIDNFDISCDENGIDDKNFKPNSLNHQNRNTNSQNKLLRLSTTNKTQNSLHSKDINSTDIPSEYTLDKYNKGISKKEDTTVDEQDGFLNVNEIIVPHSKRNTKKHFCIYCKKLQTKISRHFFTVHKNEEEVKKALSFPNRSVERSKVVNIIRKKGDFEHNTSAKHNTGVLIVSRNQQSKRKNMVDDYIVCKICKGFFSKNTLRLHRVACGALKGKRCSRIESGKLTQYIHSAANTALKTKIFPVLRLDKITKTLRYDELAIKYGNYMTEKYSVERQHDMIRAHLRLLGRFIIEIKKLDPSINELKDVFRLNLLNKCIMAIQGIAKWNETFKEFERPGVVHNLTALIQKCGKRQRIQLVRKERHDLKAEVENFLLLWEEESALINQKAIESKSNTKRHVYGKRKRSRRRNSEREKLSRHEDLNGSDSYIENSFQNSNVEYLDSPLTEVVTHQTRTTTPQNSSLSVCATKSSENSMEQRNFSILSSDTSMLEICDKNISEKNDAVKEENATLNIKQIFVPHSNTYTKKHFCIFCKTLHTKISRHLYTKHKKEEDVKRALALPKKCLARLKIMEQIRKRGDFEHNTVAEHNSGVFIVSRQQQSDRKNVVDDYVSCKNCKGFFSKKSIRMHESRCFSPASKRCNQITTRSLTQSIHPAANTYLKCTIFPLLRLDEITNEIKSDELVIKFGNYLCESYFAENANEMIQMNLRLLGHFLIEIKKLDPAINGLKDIYKSHILDKCKIAIDNVEKWNEAVKEFDIPAINQRLISLLAECGERQRRELMKQQQDKQKAELENVLLLWEEKNPLYKKVYIGDERNFEHNTSDEHNSGVFIVSGQQQSECKNVVDDYVCCKTCKESHCFSSESKSCKQITTRSLTQSIHPAADTYLKCKIFPLLRDDEITNEIKSDELVIKFGNYLSFSYFAEDAAEMIQTNLRLLGYFLREIKKLDPAINELKDIYKSHILDKCIIAIDNVETWNEAVKEFDIPGINKRLISLIAECGKRQRIELMKQSQHKLKAELENVLLLWEEKKPLYKKIYIGDERKPTYRKIRWNDDEREAVSLVFGDLKTLERLPTLKECYDAIQKSQALNRRTPEQLKSWIDNQRRYKL